MAGGHLRPVVFVVDADASVLRSLGRLLRAQGMDVRGYDAPERFLAEAEPASHACLILDLPLGRLDPDEFHRRFGQRGHRMPIIGISAHGDEATRRVAQRCGARSLYRKPVDDRTLVDAIDWVLGSGPGEVPEPGGRQRPG